MSDIIVDGHTAVWFVPTILADNMIPTVAELAEGIPLHHYLIPAGLEGFEPSQAEVDNTSLASTFDTRLPGRKSYSSTALVFKEQVELMEHITALGTEGTDGFVVIRDGVLADAAPAAGAEQKFEVYPIRTGESVMLGRGEANSVLRRRIPTPIRLAPVKGVALAA